MGTLITGYFCFVLFFNWYFVCYPSCLNGYIEIISGTKLEHLSYSILMKILSDNLCKEVCVDSNFPEFSILGQEVAMYL